MNDLIEKLEALEGPDRTLFEEAFVACFPFSMCWDFDEGQAHERLWATFTRYLDAGAWLDAALTLVPEGWTADVRRYPNGKGNAILSEWEKPCRSAKSIGDATPAIALCIAALRAQEASHAD